jgi:hypothetical protein
MTYPHTDRNSFSLTPPARARVWDLAKLQRRCCLYWMGVPTDKIRDDLGAKSTSVVTSQANAIGLYRPDWHIAKVNTAARAKSRFCR